MCTAGRIKHHLKHNIWRADCTVLFVGYQAIGTLGRRILDGEKKVKIFGETININASVVRLEGFSGHADKAGLLEWIGHFPKDVQKVFVMHGEGKVSDVFADELKASGYDAVVPTLLDTFDTSALEEAVQTVELTDETYTIDIVAELNKRLAGSSSHEAEQMHADLAALLEKWDEETA